MKATKIILAIAVITIMGVFTVRWAIGIESPDKVASSTNLFIARIESKITSLSNAPVNTFCPQTYKDIQYFITDNHRQGLLIKNGTDNNQGKETLSKKLYAAYTAKFVDQAMYVFNGSEWKIADLNFIRSEVQNLKKSEYLDPKNYFNQIDKILVKYDEIDGFISSCNNFSYPYYELLGRYPDVSDKIQQSQAYIDNNLDNSTVNNCTRLKDSLLEIPKKLFDKHISYLRKKINIHGGRYNHFNYQSDYLIKIYTPLRKQIGALDSEVYGISYDIFDNGYRSVEQLLNDYNRKAVNYFRN